MAALIAMELPDEYSADDSQNIIQSKLAFLDEIVPPTLDDAVLGQYEGYREHHSVSVPSDQSEAAAKTRQVTFATVKLNVDSERWKECHSCLRRESL